MLVLTRKPQEKIRIGENITITVIKTKGKGVRLGIEAPEDLTVLRGELLAARDSFDSESKPAPAKPAASTSEPSVSFAKVKRSRVGTVLPNLLGEPGPLRELLNARSTAEV